MAFVHHQLHNLAPIPQGFKLGICNTPPVGVPYALLCLANNSAITTTFKTMHDRFAKLYKRRYGLLLLLPLCMKQMREPQGGGSAGGMTRQGRQGSAYSSSILDTLRMCVSHNAPFMRLPDSAWPIISTGSKPTTTSSVLHA